MFSYLWNWFFPSDNIEKAKNLLLSSCIRRRYIKQRKSIIKIQKCYRNYFRLMDIEEEIFLKLSRRKIKNIQSNVNNN